MKIPALALVIVSCFVAAAPALAGESPADLLQFTLQLGPNGKPRASKAITSATVTSSTFNLRVTCDHGVDCTKVDAKLNNVDTPFSSSSEGSASGPFTLNTIAGNVLVLTAGTDEVVRTQIALASVSAGAIPGGNAADSSQGITQLTKLLENPCLSWDGRVLVLNSEANQTRFEFKPTLFRDEAAKTPQPQVVAVDVKGHFIIPLKENIDETDTLYVYVLADARLAGFLDVKRSSAIGTGGTFSIVGEGVTLNLPTTGAEGAAVSSPTSCSYFQFIVKDFAAGTGQVDIDVDKVSDPGDAAKKPTVPGKGDKGAEPAGGAGAAAAGGADKGATPATGDSAPSVFTSVNVGSFQIIVDAVYRGMLSYGGVASGLVDKSFKTAPAAQGSGNVIVASQSGSLQYRSSILLTIFAWGPRDIEKTGPWLHHLNPVFGITTTNTTDNALVGASFDVNGFLFLAGIHLGNVTSLANGYKEGAAFSGMSADIPTTKRWTARPFFGVSVDLRGAAALLNVLVKTAAKTGSSSTSTTSNTNPTGTSTNNSTNGASGGADKNQAPAQQASPPSTLP